MTNWWFDILQTIYTFWYSSSINTAFPRAGSGRAELNGNPVSRGKKYDAITSHSMYPKVGYFWYRYPKYPIWGTKWGTKLEILQKKFSPSSYSFESQPWTINENFHFSFRFIRGAGVIFYTILLIFHYQILTILKLAWVLW